MSVDKCTPGWAHPAGLAGLASSPWHCPSTFPAPSFWQDKEFAPKHTLTLCRGWIVELGWQESDLLGSQGCSAQQLLPSWDGQTCPHLSDMRKVFTPGALCHTFLAAPGGDVETDHKCSALGTPCHSPRRELAVAEVGRASSTPEWGTAPATLPHSIPGGTLAIQASSHGLCSLLMSHQAQDKAGISPSPADARHSWLAGPHSIWEAQHQSQCWEPQGMVQPGAPPV